MNDDQLHAMRHSLAHITATAVKRLWPEAKFGVGPVVENGFYYDIDLGDTKISESDFKKIEKEMRRVINLDQKFEYSEKPVDEALEWAKEANQPYKVELLNDLKREGTTLASELDAAVMGMELPAGMGGAAHDPVRSVVDVSFYTNGDFTDLCRGPHVESTGKVGAFKLMRVAGAYWRGNEKNPQMQRLYGVAFSTQEELDSHLQMLEEAKKRDHRKLGKELDLFAFSDLVGGGLPLFTPRGTVLREVIGKYTQQMREKNGFVRVWTPVIAKTDLYKASGHWDKFGDELFLVKSQETSDEFVLRPMNCPHHIQLYASQARSYRDLPLKLMENAGDYRDEKTGELHGLSRVRSFTQDDSHSFVAASQIKEVATELVDAAKEMYKEFDMQLKFRLSFRDDSPAYLGDELLWEAAQNQIEELAKENQLDYYIEEGEAAFYGPKIDFMATDAIGREWQVATVQLDFVLPERFELEYTSEDGSKQRPVMIHCALLGSIERFLSVYIEHTGGWFPFWLAPEQIRILTINDTVLDYVEEIEAVLSGTVLMQPVKYNELRFTRDDRNESLGKKIREATGMKIPVQLIVGPQDKESRQISVRTQGGEEKVEISGLADYLNSL